MEIRDMQKIIFRRVLGKPLEVSDIIPTFIPCDSSVFRNDGEMVTMVLMDSEGERFIITVEKMR
jgi:hypothetical protein